MIFSNLMISKFSTKELSLKAASIIAKVESATFPNFTDSAWFQAYVAD
jgi:hypothetical protein